MQDIYLIEGETLRKTADAIRVKRGTTDPIDPVDYEAEILSIQSGGGGESDEELDAKLHTQTQMLAELEDEIESLDVGDDSGLGKDSNTIVNYLAGAYSGKVIDYEGKIKNIYGGSFASQWLTEINCPNVTTIGSQPSLSGDRTSGQTFYWCKNLSKISFPNCTNLYGISNFAMCSLLESAIFPKYEGTTVLKSTFFRCSALSKVEMPTVTAIGESAFVSCYNLEEAIFSPNGLSYVGFYGLESCSKLKSIKFDSVQVSVSQGGCVYCRALESVYMSCTSSIYLAYSAFGGCGIETVYINTPNLTLYRSGQFANCGKLKTVEIVKTSGGFGFAQDMFASCSALENVTISTIEGVRISMNGVFSRCSKLKWGDLSSAMISIISGQSTFYDCSSLDCVYAPWLETFSGSYVFQACTNLSYVYAPILSSFTANRPFGAGCSSLASIYIMQGSGLTEENIPIAGANALSGTIGNYTSDGHPWIYVGYEEYVPWLQNATNWASRSSWIKASQFVPPIEE